MTNEVSEGRETFDLGMRLVIEIRERCANPVVALGALGIAIGAVAELCKFGPLDEEFFRHVEFLIRAGADETRERLQVQNKVPQA